MNRDPRGSPASLAGRLVLATLGFCAAFTLLTVAVRTASAWRDQRNTIAAELSQTEQVLRRTLSRAIWEMDRESLEAHLASAAKVASVGRVTLEIRRPGRQPEQLLVRSEAWQPSTLVPTLDRELVYEPYAGAREVVGRIGLDGDERVMWARLRGEVGSIVLTQVLQSLLLATLVMWLFNRSVTVHVRHVAQHLAQLSPENLSTRLELVRPATHHDELSLLARGVNQLQRSLSDYLARQREDERELAAHRDRLAELVQQRTEALQAANAQLEAQSRCDPLTGLPNRRHFDEVKEAEFRRTQRSGQPLSLLLCDVDHFKHYNDSYGHAGGDDCLRRVGQVLQTCFSRAGELPARIGGEEFAVLLPGTDAEGAMAAAERLRQAVTAVAIVHEASNVAAHLTLSIGVAQFDPSTMDRFDTLFQQADQALYLAKRRGRNQVAR
ncbi:diguanylate cyclase [Aquincola sp. MAHUQ-54]|uniref:diguanylate cyclase n=1 Tax=Aquincola agrisoli TaxID=3119538 RepID=A0AAW9QKM0_9BURK